MKKIIKLGVISLSIAGLAGCSTLGLGGNEGATDFQTSAQATSADAANDASTDSTIVSDPTAKVSLKKNEDQIKATMYTTYNNNPQGSVKLEWKAPKNSGCYDTSFPITKYGEKNDMTWATVEIKQGDKYCSGDWTANVVYDGNVIASDSITV